MTMLVDAWHVLVDAWRAEWTKARTVASTAGLLAAAVGAGVGLSAALCAAVHHDSAELTLSGVQLAQALVAVWSVRAVTGEYRTGLIGTSLIAVPRRGCLLAAKAAVIAALSLLSGAITVGGCVLVAGLIRSLDGGATLRASVDSIVHPGLIGLLATGIALAVRDPAAAIGVVLGLLYLFPLAARLTTNASWQRHLDQIGSATAGPAVLAGWAAAAVLVGGLALRVRDP